MQSTFVTLTGSLLKFYYNWLSKQLFSARLGPCPHGKHGTVGGLVMHFTNTERAGEHLFPILAPVKDVTH